MSLNITRGLLAYCHIVLPTNKVTNLARPSERNWIWPVDIIFAGNIEVQDKTCIVEETKVLFVIHLK